jgi:hypothetical protein
MSNTIIGYDSVPLVDLKPAENNARRGDVDALEKSVRRFGQARPLVVQKGTNRIVAGNHTAEALRLVYGEEWSVDVCYVEMDDETALAYQIADNRTSDKAGYNDEQLVKVLQELQEQDALAGTGFDHDDVDDLLVAIGAIEEPPVQEFEGDYAEPEEETAARWEGREEGQRREVVFLLMKDDFERFQEQVTDLQRLWNIDSKGETIRRAVQIIHQQNAIELEGRTREVLAGGMPQQEGEEL